MQRRHSLRRTLAGLILVLILGLAVWTGAWWLATDRLQTRLAAWEAQQRAAGWTIAHDQPRRAGWPFSAALILPGPRVSGLDQVLPGGLRWTADQVTLARDIRHPWELYLAASGRQSLTLAGAKPLAFGTARCIARVPLRGGVPADNLTLRLRQLLIAVPNGGGSSASLTVPDLVATVVIDRSAGSDRAAIAAVVSAADIALPRATRISDLLGSQIGVLTFSLGITGPLAADSTPVASLGAWRDAGGSLGFHLQQFVSGPLQASGDARLTLDAGLQPQGSAHLTATGIDGAFDRLVRRHLLRHSDAVALRAMLGLLLRPGSPPRLDLPLRLTDGLVSLGRVPLVYVRRQPGR